MKLKEAIQLAKRKAAQEHAKKYWERYYQINKDKNDSI